MTATPPPVDAPHSLLGRIGLAGRALLVTFFVVWQLWFLVFRGALDLDYKRYTAGLQALPFWGSIEPAFAALDQSTATYGNWCGIEQGWSLFAGPVARGAKFLTARLEFADGSAEWVYSGNEPWATDFFRIGGWRQRKLEDYMAYTDADTLAQSEELPLWGAFVRWSVQRWRTQHPEDRRTPERVVLAARWIAFPSPGTDPAALPEPEITTIATFTPEGKLQ